jgi:hypothetical protein
MDDGVAMLDVRAGDEEGRKTHAIPLPRVLRWFWVASGVAFGLMFLVDYLEYRAGWAWSTRDPLSDKLFGDLLEYVPTFHCLHHSEFFVGTAAHHAVAYPPFGVALLAFVYGTGHPVLCWLLIVGVAMAVGVWKALQLIVARGVNRFVAALFLVTTAVMSFPIEGLVQRANVELFVWIFVALGCWMFLRGRDDAAAVLWGLAAATKLYPVILFALFLGGKRGRAFSVACLAAIGSTVAAMAFIGPTITTVWRGSIEGIFGYQGIRGAEWSMHELAANHSLFLWFKLWAAMVHVSSAALTKPYLVIGGALFAAVYFGRVRRMPLTNQLLIVMIFMVTLPQVSYFYTLVQLYVPWFLLVLLAIDAERNGTHVDGLSVTILLFVPVFAAFTIFNFRHALLFGGLVQSFVLGVILLRGLNFSFGGINVAKQAGSPERLESKHSNRLRQSKSE